MAKKASPKKNSNPVKRTRAKSVAPDKIFHAGEEPELNDIAQEQGDGTAEEHLTKLESPDTSRALAPLDPVALYLNEIKRYPVLSREDENALAVKFFETKDPQAAQALVTANLRFVVKIAAEYSRFGAKMIDLIQEGNIGLMHAIREYNPYKGVRLISYAVWWIKGYIHEYLMKQYSLVKIGTTQTQRRLFYKLQKEKEALESMGEDASFALLGSRLGASEDEIKSMSQRLQGKDISLNQPLDDETSKTLMDMQSSDSDVPLDEKIALEEQLEILRSKINEIRPKLSARETLILEKRLLADEPMTLQEIGDLYGVTREAVHQMETRVLKKIKELFMQKT